MKRPNIIFLVSCLVIGAVTLAVVGGIVLTNVAMGLRSPEEGRRWPKDIKGCLLEIGGDGTIRVHSSRGVNYHTLPHYVHDGYWAGFSERLGAAIMVDRTSERLYSVTLDANQQVVARRLPHDWVFDWGWSLTDEILYKIVGSGDQVRLIQRNLLTRKEVIQNIHWLPEGVHCKSEWESVPSVSKDGSITYDVHSPDGDSVILYARKLSETPQVLASGDNPHWMQQSTTIAYAPEGNTANDISLVYTDILRGTENKISLWRATGLWKLTSIMPFPQDRPWFITRIDSASPHHLICQVQRYKYPDNWFYVVDLKDGGVVQLPVQTGDCLWFPADTARDGR
ncbi:MAG: hypothetical protein ACOX3G_12715 [Armatimonadota bacterium]